MMQFQDRKRDLREKVLNSIDYTREISDSEVEEIIDRVMLQEEALQVCSIRVRQRLRKELFDSLRRLDILQLFVEDPSVTEIMINGKENIFVEREGRLEQLELQFESEEKLQTVIQQIVAGCNRTVNEASPIVDARLPDGARVNVVMNPVAINGPAVTVRRFPQTPITMEELERRLSVSREASDLLKRLVRAKYNIFISGGTGSGKTTFLNALSEFIPQQERVITIEDNAELQLLGIPNLVQLEARNGTAEGCREITIRELIRTSLRMRPDRIIVGEVRGPEAIDMIQAMNTGHEGSMSTGHANSAPDMLSRLENMILMGMEIPLEAVRHQVAAGIDIMIHLGRLRDGSRRVLEVVELTGYGPDGYCLNSLFRFREDEQATQGTVQGALIKEGRLLNEKKLEKAGLA